MGAIFALVNFNAHKKLFFSQSVRSSGNFNANGPILGKQVGCAIGTVFWKLALRVFFLQSRGENKNLAVLTLYMSSGMKK